LSRAEWLTVDSALAALGLTMLRRFVASGVTAAAGSRATFNA
jgi:hypothetical protein